MELIEEELDRIKKRNIRVEADKAWEKSLVRIASISGITYLIATVALFAIGNDAPYRNALIPTLGYFLSTQSLPFIRTLWERNRSADQK